MLGMKLQSCLKNFVFCLLSLIVIFHVFTIPVHAQDDTNAAITIIKLKNSEDSSQAVPISGSSYSLFKIAPTEELSVDNQKALVLKYADKTIEELKSMAYDGEFYNSEVTDLNGSTTVSNMTPGVYYVVEVNQSSNIQQLWKSVPFVVLLLPNQPTTVYPKTEENNLPAMTTYTVKKKWVGKELSSVIVRLKKSGRIVDTAELNSSNNWSFTFSNLLVDATYSVEEVVPEGYAATYTKMSKKHGMIITNTELTKNQIPIIKTGTFGIYLLIGTALVLIALGYRFYKSNKF